MGPSEAKRDGQLSASGSSISHIKGEVSVLLARYGESQAEVPGVDRLVKAVDGGADIGSMSSSVGDMVWTLGDACTGAGELIGSNAEGTV